MLFLSTLISYIIVVIVFVAVICLGVFAGIILRKNSNKKADITEKSEE